MKIPTLTFPTSVSTTFFNKLPEHAQRVKNFVELRGQELFNYLKSDACKKKCFLITKVFLSSLVFPTYAPLFIGNPIGLTQQTIMFLIPLAFYLFTKCDRAWLDFDHIDKQLIPLVIKTTVIAAGLTNQAYLISILALIHCGMINSPKELYGQVDLKDLEQIFTEKGAHDEYVFFLTLKAPALEEIFFRGFLMDMIYSIQTYANKMNLIDDVNSTKQKTVRIALQAICFTYIHYSPKNGFSNYPTLACVAILGATFGYLMEKTSNIAIPLFHHSWNNYIGNLPTIYG